MFSKKTPFRFALTAALMLSSFALQGKSPVALNDGPAPTPLCDPSNPKCKIPTMNPWDGPAPTPLCDPSNPHCKIPTMNPW